MRSPHTIKHSKQVFGRFYKISRAKSGIVMISMLNVSKLEFSTCLLAHIDNSCSEFQITNSSFLCVSVSYTEIVNFIQGYIDNEINFNREDTCSKQCSDFKHVDYHICRNNTLCILNYLDKNKTRCDGDIRSCEFIESDMHVCPNVSAAHHFHH